MNHCGKPHVDNQGNMVGCRSESIRNEDASYLMYLVCKELKLNREKITNNLIQTIETVVSMDITAADTTALAVKIEETKKKRISLIDLYTSGDIDKDEFTALRAKYDTEIQNLMNMSSGIEKQQELLLKQQELMRDIKSAVEELVQGIQYEDEFYSQLLDKMVVNDREHIDVYLNMLPHKWSFAVSESLKAVRLCKEQTVENKTDTKSRSIKASPNEKTENVITETDIPISVNNPIPILSGMVNRCDRYLNDALSSPSGPPYWLNIIPASLGFLLFILTGICVLFSNINIFVPP